MFMASCLSINQQEELESNKRYFTWGDVDVQGHFPDVGHHTQKQRNEQVRVAEHSTGHSHAKTAAYKGTSPHSELSPPVARQIISRRFVPAAGSTVFSLQTNHSRVRTERSRGRLFFSVVWFCITARLLGSHTSKQSEPTEKRPLDWEHRLQSIHQNVISLKSLSCHDLIKRAGLNIRQLHFTSNKLVFSCAVSIMYRASPNLSLGLSAQWASLFVVNGPVFSRSLLIH